MRVLLAAVDAQKGDLDGNLARHLAMLEQARAQGCDLAVFPEFSLTGSVDPRRHPERALSVDAEPVRALLQGTFRCGVAGVRGTRCGSLAAPVVPALLVAVTVQTIEAPSSAAVSV